MIPNLGVHNVTDLLTLWLIEASGENCSSIIISSDEGWRTCYPACPLAPPWPADSSKKWSLVRWDKRGEVDLYLVLEAVSKRNDSSSNLGPGDEKTDFSEEKWHLSRLRYFTRRRSKTQTDCLSLLNNYVTPCLSKLQLQLMGFGRELGVANAVFTVGLLISKSKIWSLNDETVSLVVSVLVEDN